MTEYISSPLRNPRHERFAIALSTGDTQVDAYKKAGYAPDDSNSAKLANLPEVVERVAYLLDEAARATDVRRERIVVDLDNIARADISEYYEEVDGQVRLKNLLRLPKRLSVAIASVKTKANGVVELKLKDGQAAQTTLLRYLGGLPEAPAPQTTNIFHVLPADDQRALADALEALARAYGGAGRAAPGERGSD